MLIIIRTLVGGQFGTSSKMSMSILLSITREISGKSVLSLNSNPLQIPLPTSKSGLTCIGPELLIEEEPVLRLLLLGGTICRVQDTIRPISENPLAGWLPK